MKRKVPLKRGAPPKRTRRPKRRSDKAKSFDEWRAHERVIVLGRLWCEAWLPGAAKDFRVPCGSYGTEVHHNFGRTNEPWSSWNKLCSLLCRNHHLAVTGEIGKGLDMAMRLRLRADAARRVMAIFHPDLSLSDDEEAVAWMHGQLLNLPAFGVMPPDYDRWAAR
jgi:hypothetical protein